MILEQAAQEQVNELMKKIAEQLEQQIQDGAIELESLGQQVIIRIRENGSFPSGSAFLQPKFRPIMREIGELLNTVPGEIMVSGNTDNRGVNSELFSSNWELSSKRAVSIAHELIKVPGFDPARLSLRLDMQILDHLCQILMRLIAVEIAVLKFPLIKVKPKKQSRIGITKDY